MTQLDRIEKRLERVESKLDVIVPETARNTASLVEHMEQTRLLKNEISTRVPPLEAHVQNWAGVGKAIAVIAALIGIAYAAMKIASSAW